MPDWLYELLHSVAFEEGRKAFKNGQPPDCPYDSAFYAEYAGWMNVWLCGWDE